MRWIYRLAVYVAAPLHAAWVSLRVRTPPHPHAPRLAERFGFGPPLGGAPVWIHAASVGELQPAAALVKALRAQRPQLPILLTTFTPTGAARAAALAPAIAVRYLPYDAPGPVRRFLDRTRPRLAIILETELWPTLLHRCRERGIPLVIASARLSSRSARRYRRFGALFGPALQGALIAAQSAQDAERFRDIGAEPARTHVIGNLKFDCTLPPGIAERGRALRERYAGRGPLWVAGSTHEGEDAPAIEAHQRVREVLPGAVLVLAPRHPQRFESVAALLEARGVRTVRHSRSSGSAPVAEHAVVLLDTLGELVDFYAAADAAFVGGSLVPVGGHNLLEPAALGVPIATGPHQSNGEEIARLLLSRGAAQRVHNARELADCMIAWLRDPLERARVGTAGREAVAENRGALERLLALLDPLLENVGP
ncbi:MAG: lipid IV(A) 3-deoxy-D-manno-octulosonic acid transferase [Steroidobacteraceae bacterium]